MSIYFTTLDNISDTAQKILKEFSDNRIFGFYGEMGAGKTTLIKELCKILEIENVTSSPTFAIINEYAAGKEKIYHFDFYRINKPEEALDFGYEDYFYSGSFCFVEWPEKIADLLPQDTLKLYITEEADGSREISF